MFKINISEKGKAWKLETEDESLVGKALGETIEGKDLDAKLEDYQLQITGASDIAGFPHSKNVEGLGLKRVLLTRGWGMRQTRPKGLRLKKTVRGKLISAKTSQINLSVIKPGKRPLQEIFPDQNKPKEKAQAQSAEQAQAQEAQPQTQPQEAVAPAT